MKRRFVFFLFQMLGLAVHGATPHLEDMQSDGALHFEVQLVRSSIGLNEDWLTLCHQLRIDGSGRGYSDWNIPQLEAWMLPEGPDAIAVVGPGFGPSVFATAGLSSSWSGSKRGEPARIRQMDGTRYEIETATGARFRYAGGSLIAIEMIDQIYNVECRGGGIARVTSTEGREVMRVDRDEFGRIASIRCSGSTLNFQYVTGTRTLVRVADGGGAELIAFKYETNLLATVDLRGKEEETIAWKSNPEHKMGIRRWERPPVVVQRVNDWVYDYSIRGPIIMLTARNLKSDKPEILEINTLTGAAIPGGEPISPEGEMNRRL